MAILEVHDGRGRVDRVEVRRDEPILFGASPTCSIVLGGAGIAPVHGRIQWNKRKFKLDTGTDVAAIELNGKKVKSSTLYQGDEIRVGPCRIFVISTEQESNDKAEDDRTRIEPAPKASAVMSPTPARAATSFEADSFEEMLQPSGRSRSGSSRKHKKRSGHRQIDALAGDDDFRPVKVKAPDGIWAKVRARLVQSSDAPGQERVISSPVVIGLAVAFVVIAVLSFGLYRIIVKTTAERQYTKAFQSIDDGDYRNAIKQLDLFLTENPRDPRADKAKVFRALARVRQFTTSSGASWVQALQASQAMVSEVGNLPAYRDASTELGEQLVKTVEGLADRARAGADLESLKAAEAALALQGRVAGKAAEGQVSRSKALLKLTQARDAIRRAEVRARAIAAMNDALKAGSASKVYALRDELTGLYPDLAADKDVVARLLQANDLIRQAARLDPSSRPGEIEPHPDALGPPTTLVLRLDPGRSASNAGSIVYASADGLIFGLDGTTGAPLWQVPVGISTPFPPLAIAGGEPSVLAVDARYDELIRLDGRTGKLVWRQELGERVVAPPLVLGNQVFQPTPTGKILQIDLNTGSLQGTLNLGRKPAMSLVPDESGEHLYLMGDEDCLFVLGRDPLSCQAVEYLGQEAGSVACTPARVGRFLIVPENTTLNDGRWRIFVIDPEGVSVKLKQTIPIAGWTWRTPSASGSIVWSASDRGEVAAFSVGLHDSDDPFKLVAGITADNDPSGPAFGLARTEREFWLGAAHPSRFDLGMETRKLSTSWTIGQTGAALAPIQTSGKLVVFTQESTESPGVGLWGIDSVGGSVVWRTTLGAPWPVEIAVGQDPGSLNTIGFDGLPMSIKAPALAQGGFLEQPLPKPGTFRVPSVGAQWLRCGSYHVLVPEPGSNHVLVRTGDQPFRVVELPASLGARPIAWGADLLIPGADGRVYLIDPNTGELAADPFVPRFDRAHPSVWKSPVAVEGNAVVLADDTGHLRRLTRAATPRPHLAVSAEVSIGKGLAANLASTGQAVIVATLDGKLRVLASRDLSPAGSVDLDAGRLMGPTAVGSHGFAADSAGNLVAFATEGRKLWEARLPGLVDFAPAIRGDTAVFLTRAGGVEIRGLADGKSREHRSIGALPSGPPIVTGPTLLIRTGSGSIRPLADAKSASPTTEE